MTGLIMAIFERRTGPIVVHDRSAAKPLELPVAPYAYPTEIEFIDALPMTTTGKVQRRVLRLREEERAKAAR